MAKRKRKQLSGGAKLRLSGKRAVMLGLTPDVYDKLKRASEIECRPVSQFVTFYALQAAEWVLSAKM